jgi:hypothetical protein
VEFSSPLATVTPTVDGDVLAILSGSDGWFTTTLLQEQIPTRSVPGIRNVLIRLVEQGIVQSMIVGRVHQYRLNRQHIAAEPIIALARLQDAFTQRAGAAMGAWHEPPLFAALCPSVSPVLRIVAIMPRRVHERIWNDQVSEFEAAAQLWTGNAVTVIAVGEDAVGEASILLDEVARDGIVILGDFAWFRRSIAMAQLELQGK